MANARTPSAADVAAATVKGADHDFFLREPLSITTDVLVIGAAWPAPGRERAAEAGAKVILIRARHERRDGGAA